MLEIIRTNDAVLLNFAQTLLRDAGVATMVADENMSVLEGSIGVFPRRLMVAADAWAMAERVLVDADLGAWVTRDGAD